MTLLNADIEQRQAEIGEDTVELFELIQESFGIEFAEADEVIGKSVRELAECISTKSEASSEGGCLCAATFYLLRREFYSLHNTPRALMRPSTSLSKLLPWAGRKSDWRTLQEQTGLALPSLTLPSWVLVTSLVIAVVTVKVVITSAGAIGWHFGWPTLPLGSFLVWMGLITISNPLVQSLPRGCDTFGDLVRLTAARNYSILSSRFCGSSEREMILLLRQLIAAQVGIDMDKITPETQIPEGLNIY